MGWFIGMVFAVAVFFILRGIGRTLSRSRSEDDQTAGHRCRVAAPIVLTAWFFVQTVGEGYHAIDAGHVGIVYEFGAIKGQISEGANLIWPWRSVRVENTQVQRHRFTGDKQLSSFSKETQTVNIQASLNIRVSPETVQELYRAVGPNFFETLIEPRVSQNFKDEIVKYNSVEIAPNREKIRKAVKDRLEKELSKYSIEVVDLLLDNIDFTDAFEKAIEQKQIATQKALEEEQKVIVERNKALQAVETAKGRGGAILAEAEKQAEANQKLAASLTPALVQYTMIQKLAPNISVMLLPAGQNFILDPSAFKIEKK